MFNISSFLEKFKNITHPDKFIKDEFIGVAKDILGINIKKENIAVRDGKIFLSVDPIVKNEIFLRKEAVLENLKERLKIYKKTIKSLH